MPPRLLSLSNKYSGPLPMAVERWSIPKVLLVLHNTNIKGGDSNQYCGDVSDNTRGDSRSRLLQVVLCTFHYLLVTYIYFRVKAKVHQAGPGLDLLKVVKVFLDGNELVISSKYLR